MLAFYGTSGGKQAILLHLYGDDAGAHHLRAALTIPSNPTGQFGTVLSAQIPTLAGGVGSVTKIDMTVRPQLHL